MAVSGGVLNVQSKKPLVLVVAVALGVTACGGDDLGNETPADEQEAAAGVDDAEQTDGSGETEQATGSEESTQVGADSSADGQGVDTIALFKAIADATVAEGSYEFEATTGVDEMVSTATGAIRVGSSLDESNMRMRITSFAHGSGEGSTSINTTVLVVDGKFYIDVTDDMPQAGEGSWLVIDPASVDPFAVIMDSRGVPTAEAIDDIRSLNDQVADLTKNPDMVTVTEVGPAEINGVATTEYHVVVNDVAGFLDSGDETLAELNDGLSYSMWVGDDDLIRKIVTVGVNGLGTTEMTYRNYGADVDVEAPPADEVVDPSG